MRQAPPPRIAVVMGGRSGEHDVSLDSGREVLTHLPRDRFTPFPVAIGRDGKWRFGPDGATVVAGDPLALPEALRRLLDRAPAAVFLALHGPEGEDGKLQSLLDLVGLRYTCSDAYASSLAMNKPQAKAVMRAAGLPVPADWSIPRRDYERDPAAIVSALRERFTPPWVLKTPKLGSSVGLEIAHDPADLPRILADLFALDAIVLAEQFIAGRELTSAVLDCAGRLEALPLVEIRPVSEPFFNYKAKYTAGEATEICPAPVDDDVRRAAQAIGLRTHQIFGCRGVSRTDLILDEAGALHVLEINTIPGLTQTSLLPQAAAAAGIAFGELCALMLAEALVG